MITEWLSLGAAVLALLGPGLSSIVRNRARPAHLVGERFHALAQRLERERDPETIPDTRGLPVYRGEPL